MDHEPDRCPPLPAQPATGELERLRSPLGLLFGHDQGASGDFRAELVAVREARKCRETAAATDARTTAPDTPGPPRGGAAFWWHRLWSVLGKSP